jgi:SagB-type dehydrogenase family enzyme
VKSSARRQPLYRRSAYLVCHWAESGFTIANHATGLQAVASPLAARVLDFFAGWRSLDELCAHLTEFDRPSLAAALQLLEKCTLLERQDAPRAAPRAHASWSTWNPAAGYFHFSTKDVPFVRDYEAGERQFRRHVKTHPMPPAVLKRRGAPFRALPPADRGGEFRGVLEGRRTWRRFARRPLDLQSLGTLFDLTFRIQEWMTVEGQGRVPLKTSPSGGARHPLEAYVLARSVRGLPRGLYHYRPDRHGLERLTKTATPRQIEDYLPSQHWYRGASALVLMTAVFERSRWRYHHPRGYRAVLIEAGHFCQTFLLTATWLGLAPFCSMALADSRIEADLGIDGVGESVLYAAGVGTRPAGVARAQAPAARRGRLAPGPKRATIRA